MIASALSRRNGLDWTRLLFALAAFLTWAPKALAILDNYSSAGIVVASGPMAWTRWVIWSPSTAWIIWGALMVSLVFILFDRTLKPGLLLFMTSALALLGAEGINMKAYDRLLVWQAFALLFSDPKGGRNEWARLAMIIIYCNLYFSTGLFKAMEKSWWDGTALAYDLVDNHFGMKAAGVWLSDKPFLLVPLSWFTIFYETAFAFLIWFRRTNPCLLILGVLFHLGIHFTMEVNTFFFVVVAAYPLMWLSARNEKEKA